MGATRRILVFKNLSPTDILFSSLVTLLTLPYHRFFTYNTLRPAQEIQKHAQQGGVDDRFSPERQHLYSILVAWRSRKRDEINFAVVAATVITAIVTASFSWGNVADSLWVGPAFWYASLSTSICGIFLGAQQLSVLSLLGELPALEEDVEDEEEGGRRKKKKKKQASSSKVSGRTMRRHLAQILYEVPARQPVSSAGGEELGEKDRTTVVEATGGGAAQRATTTSPATDWKISWRSIFTWQCPMMFIAYSTLFYIVGLSVVVLTPLIKEDWGENSYVSPTYIQFSCDRCPRHLPVDACQWFTSRFLPTQKVSSALQRRELMSLDYDGCTYIPTRLTT